MLETGLPIRTLGEFEVKLLFIYGEVEVNHNGFEVKGRGSLVSGKRASLARRDQAACGAPQEQAAAALETGSRTWTFGIGDGFKARPTG